MPIEMYPWADRGIADRDSRAQAAASLTLPSSRFAATMPTKKRLLLYLSELKKKNFKSTARQTDHYYGMFFANESA
jgi:hypothetical protein